MEISSIQCIDIDDGKAKMICPKVYKRDGFNNSIRCRAVWLDKPVTASTDLCLLYCKSSAFRVFDEEPYKLNVLAAFSPQAKEQFHEFYNPAQLPMNTTPEKLSFFVVNASDNKLCKIKGKAIIEILGDIKDSLLL